LIPGGPVSNDIIPDVGPIPGDLLFFMIVLIVLLVLTVYLGKYVSKTRALEKELDKEILYADKLEDACKRLKADADRLKRERDAIKLYNQRAQQEHAIPAPETVPEGYQAQHVGVGEMEVIQHYEDVSDLTKVDSSQSYEPASAPVVEEEEEVKQAPAVAKAKIVARPAPEVEKEADFKIRDVFLIYKDGRLITHLSKKVRIIDDSEIIGAMITSVQMFVKESFRRESRGALDLMKFGKLTILAEYGEFANLAVVIEGKKIGDLRVSMRKALDMIHDSNKKQLESWDGRLSKLGSEEKIIKEELLDKYGTEEFHKSDAKVLDLSQAGTFKITK
jgi:hypothetical protein